ncbi:MAG: helix-turn-helix domain-containing protein [Bacteroidales bacterium]|nr:helix-turn-helix domain-containing protein [Bacteroidales bacterium]
MNTELDFIPQECKRIRAIQEGEHLTMSEFAKEIGKSAATVTNIFKGRNKPSIDLLQSVLDRFRVINPEWLLMGVGPMYRQKSGSTEQLLLDIRPEEPETGQAEALTTISAAADTNRKKNLPATQVVERMIIEKKIQKIVVFYDDGTFEELNKS